MEVSIAHPETKNHQNSASDIWDIVASYSESLLGDIASTRLGLDKINALLKEKGSPLRLEQNPQRKRCFSIVSCDSIGSEYLVYQAIEHKKTFQGLSFHAFRQPVPKPSKLAIQGHPADSINIGIRTSEQEIHLEFYIKNHERNYAEEAHSWTKWIIGEEEYLAYISSINVLEEPESPIEFICSAKDFREAYKLLKKRMLKSSRYH